MTQKADDKINVFWFLPTHGDGRYLGTAEGGRPVDLPYLQQVEPDGKKLRGLLAGGRGAGAADPAPALAGGRSSGPAAADAGGEDGDDARPSVGRSAAD